MKKTAWIAFAFVTLAAAVAQAETKPYEPGKVSVFVPDGWKSAAQAGDGGAMLVAVDPTENAMLLYLIVDGANVKAALKSMDEELGKVVSDYDVGKGKATKVNGMPAMAITGSGKIEGKACSLLLLLVETPNKKVLMVVGIVTKEKESAFGGTLKQVLSGIKPL